MILAFICALCVYSNRNGRAVYIPGRQLSCYSCLSCLKIAELLQNILSSKEVIMTLREKVESALQKIRPSLQADGGDVQLVDVDNDGLVQVRLTGACHGCPMSQMTLKMGIEKILKQNIPEIKSVESI
jgi:Fe-S cluster biogenesis protein NfuA